MKTHGFGRLVAIVFLSSIAGAVVAATVSPSRAQPPTAAGSVCVEIAGINSLRNLNETIRRQEAMGYELSVFAAPAIPCFRRR